VRGIETNESRQAICREWQNQINRNHTPGEFDKLIAEVTIGMGRDNIDAVRIRNRFYDQWEQELSLLESKYELRTDVLLMLVSLPSMTIFAESPLSMTSFLKS